MKLYTKTDWVKAICVLLFFIATTHAWLFSLTKFSQWFIYHVFGNDVSSYFWITYVWWLVVWWICTAIVVGKPTKRRF